MVLNQLRDKFKGIYTRAGFTMNGMKKIIDKMLSEVKVMKQSPNNKDLIDSKLINLQILLLEASVIYSTDLDLGWKKNFKKYKKRMEKI